MLTPAVIQQKELQQMDSDEPPKVVSLRGQPTGERKVNANAVAAAQRLLEQAQAGEVIGVAVVTLHYDSAAAFDMAGKLGGYSMLGACDMVHDLLVEVNKETTVHEPQ